MNLEERLKKLAEQAKDKAGKSKDDKQKERLIRWAKLKKQAPDTAEFVELMSKTFGKPQRLGIKYDNEKWERWA